jgi:hypothetical protein
MGTPPAALTHGQRIRLYTPSQLIDDMQGRNDCEDFTCYEYSVGDHQIEVVIVHKKTGLRGRSLGLPGVFHNKREAWAQLHEQLHHHYGPLTDL